MSAMARTYARTSCGSGQIVRPCRWVRDRTLPGKRRVCRKSVTVVHAAPRERAEPEGEPATAQKSGLTQGGAPGYTVTMSDAKLGVYARGDGSYRSLPPAVAGALVGLLLDPDTQRRLVARGLDLSRGERGFRMRAASLHVALVRMAGDLQLQLHDAPSALRGQRLIGGQRRDVLIDLMHALAPLARGTAAESFEVVVELDEMAGAERAFRLEVVPEPPAPRALLLSMASVEAQDVPTLFDALDRLVEDLPLDHAVLERTLIPLLGDARHAGRAARVLGRAGVASAAGALERVLAGTLSVTSRLEILGALMRLGHRALGHRTLKCMLIHGSAAARRGVVSLLREVATEGDVAFVYELLRISGQPERVALAALAYALGDLRAYGEVASALGRLGPDVPLAEIEHVLRAALETGSRRFVPLLRGYAGRERRAFPAHRARAVAADLEQTGRDEATPEQLLEAAEAEAQAGAGRASLALLDELLLLEPSHVRALHRRASGLKELGRPREALADAERALALDASRWRTHRLHGSLLWDLGRQRAALQAYDRVLALNPVDPYSWYYKAYVLYRLERYEEALPCVERALSLKPDSPFIHAQKAFCLERLRRFDEAVRCYRRCLQLRPEDLSLRSHLGQALQAGGRLDEALACHDQVLALAPHREDALLHRASVLQALERLHEAAEAFAAYLAVRPESFDAHYQRGLCLRAGGRRREAAESFRQALVLRPASVAARTAFADCSRSD